MKPRFPCTSTQAEGLKEMGVPQHREQLAAIYQVKRRPPISLSPGAGSRCSTSVDVASAAARNWSSGRRSSSRCPYWNLLDFSRKGWMWDVIGSFQRLFLSQVFSGSQEKPTSWTTPIDPEKPCQHRPFSGDRSATFKRAPKPSQKPPIPLKTSSNPFFERLRRQAAVEGHGARQLQVTAGGASQVEGLWSL